MQPGRLRILNAFEDPGYNIEAIEDGGRYRWDGQSVHGL